MSKDILWPWAIKNSVVLLAWTALAITFDKWWIALFSMLCMSSIKTTHKTYRVCDKCGKHSPYADSHNDALDKAKAAGWVHYADGNKDYCPDCQ